MNELESRRCVPCEGGVAALDREQAETLLAKLQSDWELSDDARQIRKEFRFKGYYKTIAFVNAVAWIANREDHHPDLEVGYASCVVGYTTHAIGGLSENDFICAAKIDALGADGPRG
jgi:4a-hydroxytetrahydrobiopterin dehydratase